MNKSRPAVLWITAVILMMALGGVAFWLTRSSNKFVTIDLKRYYNAELHVGWVPDFNPRNNLASLPRGRQLFHEIPFDVRGVIQLQSTEAQKNRATFPEAVEGITIGQTCRRLHILHGTAYPDAEGTSLAKLVLHYQGGLQQELEIRYGEQVLDWWCKFPDNGTDPGTRVAWRGENSIAKANTKKLRLFQTRFANPLPQAKLLKIDYVSTMSKSAPFLIALTLEK